MFNRIVTKFRNIKHRIIRAYYKRKVLQKLTLAERDCIICRKNNFQTLHAVDRYNLPIKTVRCTTCGLVQENPMPQEEFLRHFYSSRMYRGMYRGERKATKHYVQTNKANARARVNAPYVVELAQKAGLTTPTILDYGSSDGTFLLSLKEQLPGTKIYGLEPGTNFSFWSASALDGGFSSLDEIPPDKMFDVITLWHVLEHLYNPIEALAALREKLSPNGFLIVEVPDLETYTSLKSIHIGHLWHFDKTTLRKIAEKAGFSNIEITKEACEPTAVKAILKKQN